MNIVVRNKPVFFENKDFKTIQIKVMFPFKKSDDDYAMMQVLPGLLHLYTNNYPTEKEFSMILDKNYVLACFCVTGSIGDMSYLSFNMSIPDSFIVNRIDFLPSLSDIAFMAVNGLENLLLNILM